MVNLPLGKTADAPITFKAGTVIFAPGETSKYLYIIKKGDIRLVKINGQKLSLIKLCKEREILNEVSVLTMKPVDFGAIAKTDVELILVEQKDILSVIKGGPTWIPEIFDTLCERLSSTQDMIDEHNLLAGEKNPDLVLSKDDEKKYLHAFSEYKSN
ncbi:MAG: cyclic nucleotide-binding domain-containing protein [Bacteriovorax sp.]|jgi:CRP/FNR family transcriptional regulator